MLWTLLALLLWIVLGGFISYYGDLQGRRWGKKRVSWFGLRPKHTAILITSLTGAFIALCSILTVYAIAPTVREVILRGERAIRDNKQLSEQYKQQVRDSQRQEDGLKAEIANDQQKLAGKQNDLDRIQQSNTQLQASQTNLQRQSERLKQQIGGMQYQQKILSSQIEESHRVQAKLVANNAQLGASNRRLIKVRQTLVKAKQQLVRDKSRLARDRASLAESVRELGIFNERQEINNKDLAKSNLQLIKNNTDLEQRTAELNAAIAKTTQEIALKEISIKQLQKQEQELTLGNRVLERSNTELIRQSSNLAQANARLERDYAELSQRQNSLINRLALATQSYSGLRQSRLSLRAGAELARRTIDAHTRPEVVLEELTSLMKDANATALTYGAARTENGMAALIVDRQATTAATQDPTAQLDALAKQYAGQDKPLVIVANTIDNVLEGEPALLELNTYPVSTIFDKGATVASQRINARQDTGRVFEAIVQFLQKDVRDAAIKAGTIPRIDPETGVRQVGSLGTADLISLTERVRKVRGDVEIVAVAAAPMTSADYPLRLRFDVRRAPTLPTMPDPFHRFDPTPGGLESLR